MTQEKFDYTCHKGRTYHWYEKFLYAFKGLDKPVLDVGAGIGLFLEACRANDIDCFGVEFEQEGVDICKQKGLICYQQDLSKPMDYIEDNSVGGVFFNQVIEHIPLQAQRLALREIWRVLEPNGILMVNSPCRHFETARRDKYHISLLTPSELRILLTEAGFEVTRDLNWPQEVPPVPDIVIKQIWQLYKPDLLSQSASFIAEKRICNDPDNYYSYVNDNSKFEKLTDLGKSVECFVREHRLLSVTGKILTAPLESPKAALLSFKSDGENKKIPRCPVSDNDDIGYFRYLPVSDGAWKEFEITISVPDGAMNMTAKARPWGNKFNVFVIDLRAFAHN